MEGYAEPVEPPAKGLGTSDGGKGSWKLCQGQATTQGTVKNFKEFGVEREWKFAPGKRLGSGQWPQSRPNYN